MTARIIVACGSGVATSQTVASKVQRLLKAEGADAECEAVDIKSLKHYIKNADIYISIVKEDTDWGIPVFNGVCFLTGMGQDAELKKLLAAIDEVNKRQFLHRIWKTKVSKSRKKQIFPGKASKKRWEEAHVEPDNKFNISKAGWLIFIIVEALLLIASFFTSNILLGVGALAIGIFVERYGKDFILYDYNMQVAEYRQRFGFGKDGMTTEQRNEIMAAMRDERLRQRREKRAKRLSIKEGIDYEVALTREYEKVAAKSGLTVEEYREKEKADFIRRQEILQTNQSE